MTTVAEINRKNQTFWSSDNLTYDSSGQPRFRTAPTPALESQPQKPLVVVYRHYGERAEQINN